MTQIDQLPAIGVVVEGHGEIESIPVLLRRFFAERSVSGIGVAKPWRIKRNRFVRCGEAERVVRQLVRSRPQVAAILVVLDADDDCPAELGPDLLRRLQAATHVPSAIVLAVRELEAWFLAAKESLRGQRGIRDDASSPEAPECIRGAKERLSQNMDDGYYLETDDQPALAATMDLDLAERRAPSFARFMARVEALCGAVLGGQA